MDENKKVTPTSLQEERLRLLQSQQKKQHQKFFSLSEEIFCVLTPDGALQEINTAFCEKLEYSLEELEKLSFFDLIYIRDQEKTKAAFVDLEQGAEAVTFVNRYKKQDGSFVWLEWFLSKCTENQLICACARDVSMQKEVEQELLIKQQQYHSFVKNIQGLFIIYNFNGTILEVNQNVKDILGYSAEDLIGKSISSLARGEEIGKLMASKEKAIAEGVDEGVFRLSHQNGEIRYIYLKTHNTKIPSQPKALMSSGFDITDRLDMEQALKKAVYSENIARLKEEFMANMNHEIRTPLNAIMGFTDILRSTTLTKEQHSFVEAINLASQSLLDIVNDLLDFSAIDSGKLQLEAISFNIIEEINKIHRLMLPQAQDKKIDLNFFLDPNIPNYVIGDPIRFNQVLINLISNAIKFTEKGEVEVFANILKMDKENLSLKISVKDTGIGIPKSMQASIFDKFQQVDGKITRSYTGTGLGLSITKELLQAQGGDLSFMSVENKGSVFMATMSFKIDLNPPVSTANIELPTSLKGVKILLVEDGQLNQVLAQKLLLDLEAEVDLAINGKEAIAMLERATYDIILMDLQMPVMDGYSATHSIRHIMELDTPIIAITAHSLKGEREKCLKAGMNEYLSKPYKKEDLYRKINTFIRK